MRKIEVYQIDSGVSIPKGAGVPLGKLGVGDSVQFPLSKRASVQTVASLLKRTKGMSFTIKKVDSESCRVWRLK